jgi:branched-chain amino acid transport system ATP-binding protein
MSETAAIKSPAAPTLDGPLAARSLSASYGSMRVLSDCDVILRPGEIVGLYGHNGAGKTTLLRVLAGLKRAGGGQVHIEGRDVTSLSAAARAGRGLALVPDGARGVFPNLTVAQNIALSKTANRHAPRDNLTLLEQFFAPVLVERRNTLAGQLSGGQRQMVALSIALARHPSVLLLDEPSLGLAPKVVDDLMAAIATVARRSGTAVLVVEQNIPAVLAVADRVMIMKGGRFVLDLPASDCPPVQQLWEYF